MAVFVALIVSLMLVFLPTIKAQVQISFENVTTLEGNTPQQNLICATITSLDGNVMIESSTVTTVDSTAIAGRDYDPLSAQRLDFSMVGDSQCVAISINDDSEPEGNEIFIAQVVITIVGSERKIVSLPFLITIVDNDAGVFVPAAVNVSERGTAPVCATLVGEFPDIAFQGTLMIMTAQGSAIASSDYSTLQGFRFLNFVANEDCLNVEIIDDNEAEGAETFSVSLSIFGNVATGNTVTTVTIIDNDNVTVSVPAALTVPETDTVQVCAELSGGTTGTTIGSRLTALLNISESSQASAMANADFLPGELTLSFAEGSIDGAVQCVNISVIDDMALERNETFTASLTITSDVVILGNSLTLITVTDNDDVRVSMPPMVTVDESDGTVQVCVMLSTPENTERDVSFTLASRNGTAMAGFDYTSISVNQIFASGSANGTTKCVDIFVRDDETLEGNQTFTVAIATSDSNVMLGTDVTVISIVDNDDVQVSVPAMVVADGGVGTVLVCAMLSATENIERKIVVTLTTSDNTARAGFDYIGISSNQTFDSGSLDGSVRCANITLLDGSPSRENLNFTVTLITSDPDVALRRDLTNVVITVLDAPTTAPSTAAPTTAAPTTAAPTTAAPTTAAPTTAAPTTAAPTTAAPTTAAPTTAAPTTAAPTTAAPTTAAPTTAAPTTAAPTTAAPTTAAPTTAAPTTAAPAVPTTAAPTTAAPTTAAPTTATASPITLPFTIIVPPTSPVPLATAPPTASLRCLKFVPFLRMCKNPKSLLGRKICHHLYLNYRTCLYFRLLRTIARGVQNSAH